MVTINVSPSRNTIHANTSLTGPGGHVETFGGSMALLFLTPLHNTMDFSSMVTGCKKKYLRRGYFQIVMHLDDIPKTAVIAPFWPFRVPAPSFWVKGVYCIFQQMMDLVLAGLPFVFVYLDDIIVASPRNITSRL